MPLSAELPDDTYDRFLSQRTRLDGEQVVGPDLFDFEVGGELHESEKGKALLLKTFLASVVAASAHALLTLSTNDLGRVEAAPGTWTVARI